MFEAVKPDIVVINISNITFLLGRVAFLGHLVGQSVCPSVTTVYFEITAEAIELPFGMVSVVGPGNSVLDWRARWRHLAITVERLCAAAISGSGYLPPAMATRPVPKLLWAILFGTIENADCTVQYMTLYQARQT